MRGRLWLGVVLIILLTMFPLKQHGDSYVQADAPKGHPYKAITYNIHSGKKLTGESSIDEIADLLASESPDFIALQEVDRRRLSSGIQDQITLLADRLQMEYAYSPALQKGFSQYGNAILSKYPILSTGKLELTGGKEERVLLWAKVYTEEGSLYLTSVHLDTERASRPEHFERIREYLETELSDAPILLMGDLNALYDQPDLVQFQYRSFGKYIDYEVPTYYHHKAGRDIQIDYIFGRGIVEQEYYTVDSDASDHDPLVLVFTIGELPFIDLPDIQFFPNL